MNNENMQMKTWKMKKENRTPTISNQIQPDPTRSNQKKNMERSNMKPSNMKTLKRNYEKIKMKMKTVNNEKHTSSLPWKLKTW